MNQLPELAWIAEARKHIGLREIKGSKHNPTILINLKHGGKKTLNPGVVCLWHIAYKLQVLLFHAIGIEP